MVNVVAQIDMQGTRRMRKAKGEHHVWRTDFFVAGKGEVELPQAFLAESTPLRVLRPHYHEVDQFQLIVSGDGRLGRHELAPYRVHYARAYTPYGPITNGANGLGFLTLRAHPVPGPGQDIPANLEKLKQVPDRRPWQITGVPEFDASRPGQWRPVAGVQNDEGLAVHTMVLGAGQQVVAPDPRNGDGQYVIVLEGTLRHAGREVGAIAAAFLRPHDGPLELIAGDRGLRAMALNFPRRHCLGLAPGAQAVQGERWQCELCAFSYDEALGIPEEGIAPGTRWKDLPETWRCPDCFAGKEDFKRMT